MQVRYIWRNCDHFDDKEIDAYWVESTKIEAEKYIFPNISREHIEESRKHAETAKNFGKNPRPFCFLVSKDLSNICPLQTSFPFHQLWNGYSPFKEITKVKLSKMQDIENLEIRKRNTNPKLTSEQREALFSPLFELVKGKLQELSGGDEKLAWALRRKLAKELVYLERSTPAARNKLKALMWKKQNGICALCKQELEQNGSELDRFEAYFGYVESNVRLVHHECHVKDQKIKGYA